jgi:hypothetical protein
MWKSKAVKRREWYLKVTTSNESLRLGCPSFFVLKSDFVVRAIAKWFVGRMTATTKRKAVFLEWNYVSLRIDQLDLPFHA